MGLLPRWCFEKYSLIFLLSKAATDLVPLLPTGPPGTPPPPSSALRFLFLSEGVLGIFSGVFGSTSLSLCEEPTMDYKLIDTMKFCDRSWYISPYFEKIRNRCNINNKSLIGFEYFNISKRYFLLEIRWYSDKYNFMIRVYKSLENV